MTRAVQTPDPSQNAVGGLVGMTVCSGIGAPECAAPWISWQFSSEIEKFPSAVMAVRHPNSRNLGDMTKFKEWTDATINVLCGGTPCQSFSVAGLRKGLDDPRGNLMLTYLAIAARYRPEWVVWENVPGVLSSNGGRDFGAFLGGLGKLGYGFAYRVLDVQFGRTVRFPFAIPQRRRRVFVVGYLGDWRRAAAVLFDRESLSGNPAPRREAGQGVAPTISARPTGGGRLGTDFDCGGGLVPTWPAEVAPTLNAAFGDKQGLEDQHINGGAGAFVPAKSVTLTRQGFHSCDPEMEPIISVHGAQDPVVSENVSQAVGRNNGLENRVAWDMRGREGGAQFEGPHETANIRAASGGSSRSYVQSEYAVRRLTPTECERLMGFPDGYTAIPWRGRPAELCPDGPRYKALGNSWGVNAGEYVFDRIRLVEGIAQETAA